MALWQNISFPTPLCPRYSLDNSVVLLLFPLHMINHMWRLQQKKNKTHTQKPKLQAAEAPSWRRREKHITLYMLTSKGDTKEEGNKELEWSQATKTGSTKPLFCLCLEIILDLWRCHLEGESTSFTNKSLLTGVGEPYSILKTCFDVRCSTTKVCIIW